MLTIFWSDKEYLQLNFSILIFHQVYNNQTCCCSCPNAAEMNSCQSPQVWLPDSCKCGCTSPEPATCPGKQT